MSIIHDHLYCFCRKIYILFILNSNSICSISDIVNSINMNEHKLVMRFTIVCCFLFIWCAFQVKWNSDRYFRWWHVENICQIQSNDGYVFTKIKHGTSFSNGNSNAITDVNGRGSIHEMCSCSRENQEKSLNFRNGFAAFSELFSIFTHVILISREWWMKIKEKNI